MAEGQTTTDDRAAHARLAERLRQGLPGAEAELVQVFRRPLASLLRWRTRDPELAEELAHDALLAVIQAVRAGRLRENESLAAYLNGTARNLLANRRRRQAASPREVPVEESALIQAPPDPEILDRARLARRALASLEGLDRRIVELTLREELGSEEIGRRVGLSPDAVRMRRSRALRRLADRVRGWLRPAPSRPLEIEEEGT